MIMIDNNKLAVINNLTINIYNLKTFQKVAALEINTHSK